MFFICAWVHNLFSSDGPQVPVLPLSEKIVALVPASIDAMNEKELREYVAFLHDVLTQTTAKFKFIYEQQQKEIKFLREQNEKLANRQGV
jgi:hypothetical protein